MNTAPRTLGLVAGMGLLAAVAGCGDGNDTATGSSTSSDESTASDTSTNAPDEDNGNSSDELNDDAQALVTAGETALDEVGKGTVLAVESEDDGAVWEVEIALSDGSVQEVETSGDGQDVQSGPEAEDTDDDDKAENKELLQGAELDYEDATKKVLGAHDGRITELELDDHRGGVVWEADVHTDGQKYEVKVDASSGEVVEDEADS